MIEQRQKESLPRVLGLPQVTASGVAIIIGAGIYVLLGPASEAAGGLVWLSFIAAAVLCALTAFSYAELASMYPRASAEHEFARHAFPRWASFTVGWSMLVGLMVAAATVSLGFARYAGEHVNLSERVLAWVLLLGVAFVASRGMKQESWIVNTFAVAQIGGLLFVIVIGLDHFGEVSLLHGGGESSNAFSGVVSGAALLFFAYIGFDEVVTLSDDTKDPSRTIPQALMLALAISALLYVLVAITAANVLTPEVLAGSDHPLSDMARHTAGSWAASLVSILAMTTTIDTTLLAITASSRIAFGMAESKDMPATLGRISKSAAPRNAVIAVTIPAAALVAIGNLGLIAQATDFLVYMVFLAVNVITIRLRFTQPNVARPFRIRGNVRGVPVSAVAGFIATLAMLPFLDWEAVAVGAGLLASGVAIWFVHAMLSAKPQTRR